MKRRKFIVGVGSILGVAGAMGTGAFSSVSAERTVSISVAEDNDAFLLLEELGAGGRSVNDGGVVELRFPSYETLIEDDENIGLGKDSIYEFSQDSDEGESGGTHGLVRISNQGTQPVQVYSRHQTDSNVEIELYDVTDPEKKALRKDPPEIGVGESLNIGVRIRTFGASLGSSNESLTIVAEATTDN